MTALKSLTRAMKEAELAHKRDHFNPKDLDHKPKHPWHELIVGQSMGIARWEITEAGMRSAIRSWGQTSGWKFTAKKLELQWVVTRTL